MQNVKILCLVQPLFSIVAAVSGVAIYFGWQVLSGLDLTGKEWFNVHWAVMLVAIYTPLVWLANWLIFRNTNQVYRNYFSFIQFLVLGMWCFPIFIWIYKVISVNDSLGVSNFAIVTKMFWIGASCFFSVSSSVLLRCLIVRLVGYISDTRTGK
jgi:hypothetical protein